MQMETAERAIGFDRWGRATLLITVFAVNFLSLVYQVIWTRKIMVIFGTTALSISTILTVFLAGIALGAYLGSIWIKKARYKRRFLGILLILLGVYCLLATFVLGYIREPFIYLAGTVESQLAANLIKLLLSFVVLIVPTTIIGSTFPMITYLYSDFKKFGKDVASIYFLDTLGAAAGALVCGFFLVPAIGLRESSIIGAVVYALIGIMVYSTEKGAAAVETAAGTSPAPPGGGKAALDSIRVIVLVSLFLSGFAALTLEVAWSRYFHLLFGTSIYAFSLVLAAFLLGLSVGSVVVQKFLDRFKRPLVVFAYIEILIAVFSLLTIQTHERIENLYFKYFYGLDSFYGFQTLLFLAAFLLMLVPTSLMGANFPLAVKIFGRNRETRGDDAGLTFSVNTGGGIVGAFLAGFVIIPILGLENTGLLASAIYFLLGVVFLLAAGARIVHYAFAGALAALIAVVGYFGKEPSLNYSVYYEGIRHASLNEFIETKKRVEVLYSRHGNYGLVSVNRDPATKNIFLLNNGKTDASIHNVDMGTQLLLGHIPLFLHGSPENVLNIGLGGGFTVGALTTHPDVKSIDTVDIDPLVFEATEKFFTPYNNNALADPRVKKHVQDGRHFLETTRKKYDVIISEPPNIWVSGVSQLFTREFYRTVDEHLATGGILTQWSPAYELDQNDLKLILSTIRERFEYVAFWTNGIDYIIVASHRRPVADMSYIVGLMAVPSVSGDIERIMQGVNAGMVANFLNNPRVGFDGMEEFLKGHTLINTDNLPHLEFKTARNIFVNSRKKPRG